MVEQTPRDQNHVPAALGVSSDDGVTVLPFLIDPLTGRLLVDNTGSSGSGTVTSVSIVTANGFAGSVATATTTPAITLTTTITGILKGNGTAISEAVSNTDYQAVISLTTTGSSGAATFDGATLNIPQYSGGGGSPGGSDTQVQYNNAGAFGGITGATTNGTVLTLVAPVLGAATATSINKVTVTAPATSATLTLADGSTLVTSGANSITLTSTGATNVTLPTSGTLMVNPMTTGGDLIYGGASGVPTRLANGTAGQILTSNGTTLAPTWEDAGAGSGDVVGPASSTDNALARFDSTTGKLLQDGTVTSSGVTGGQVIISSIGDNDTVIKTGNATTGTITLVDGANGNINIEPNGSGNVGVNGNLAFADATVNIITGGMTGTVPVIQLVNGLTPDNYFVISNSNTTPSIATDGADTNIDLLISTKGSGLVRIADSLVPNSSDGAALGSTSLMFSDLFLASGGVINWNNGTLTFTQNGNELALAGTGATLIAPTVVVNTALVPDANDGAVLGSTSAAFSDLFLAEGAVINFDNGDLTLTQTGNSLTLAGGDLVLAENTSVQLDPSLSADGTYSGITITGTAGTTLAFGDLIYLAVADSRWELTDADSVTTAGAVLTGMCVQAAAGDGSATTILLQGNIRADAAFPALTVGANVYAGLTPGDIVTTAPSATDDVVHVVGKALTADSIYFNPSMDYITIV